MNFKERIEQVAINAVTPVAQRQVTFQATQQSSTSNGSGGTLGTVVSVNGTQLQVTTSSGTITVTNAGGRQVGPNDTVVITGNMFAF